MEINKESLPGGPYGEFLGHLLEHQSVWLLQAKEGLFAMFEDKNGVPYVPVWTLEKSALENAETEWEGYTPENMGIKEFMNWLKELIEDDVMLGFFPETEEGVVAIDPRDVQEHVNKLKK
jgi:hypothetical protein